MKAHRLAGFRAAYLRLGRLMFIVDWERPPYTFVGRYASILWDGRQLISIPLSRG